MMISFKEHLKQQKKLQDIHNFVEYAATVLGIKNLPKITYVTDVAFSKKYKTFGMYSPSECSIHCYIENRNLADIFRTIAHELVHHKQNEDGALYNGAGDTGSDIENEANSKAGVILRDYGKKHAFIYESVK